MDFVSESAVTQDSDYTIWCHAKTLLNFTNQISVKKYGYAGEISAMRIFSGTKTVHLPVLKEHNLFLGTVPVILYVSRESSC